MSAITPPPPQPQAGSTRHSHVAGALASEWTKLRSVRSTIWTLLVTVVVGIGFSTISVLAAKSQFQRFHPGPGGVLFFDPTRRSLTGVIFAQLVIGVLGVLVMSAEYSSGTIRATFSAIPRRLMVLAAKVAVFGAVALVVSELVSFSAFFIGQAIFATSKVLPHATLGQPGVIRAVVGSGLYLTVLALFALGLATIIRHTAGALSAFVGILLILPLLLQALPSNYINDLQRFLPLNIGVNMVQAQPQPNSFTPWVGLAVLAAYTVAALVIGGVLLVRRDA